MLVHAPIACWALTPVCDALAIGLNQDAFWTIGLNQDAFWTIGAFLAVAGAVLGALAATAGSLDFERGHAAAPKIAIAHAVLMGGAWTFSAISALGRLTSDYTVVAPPHWWAIAAGVAALVLMAAGAWCGGELVYGRGVGVRRS
jgi:uncharacterized membrane protein